LDAMQEMMVNASGDFSALIGTTEQGVTQLMKFGAPGTFKYGGEGGDYKGMNLAPRLSATRPGDMSVPFANRTGLSKFGNVDMMMDPTDPSAVQQTDCQHPMYHLL